MRTFRTVIPFALLSLAPLALSCGGGQGTNPGTPGSETAADPGSVVARVNGDPITMAELEQEAQAGLRRLEQERYELFRQTLETMAVQRVLEREAESRGVTVDELMQAEVQAKVPDPSPAEVAAYYERNKSQAGGRTLDELREPIIRRLRDQLELEREAEFVNELKAGVEFAVFVEPPRVDYEIPADAPVRGPADAPLTIVEFADFQCPYCRRAHPTVERLLTEFADEVRYVFRDFPLEKHQRAVPASRAARCAGDQGKYWDYYQHLMVMTGDLSDADLQSRAEQVGLDPAAFADCYDSERHTDAILDAFEQGTELGIGGTPTFLINGRMVEGAKSYAELRTVIEEELSAVERRAGVGS